MAGSALVKAAEAKIELIRRQAWNDFYIFAKYVCGRNLMEEIPHREVCEFLTAGLEVSAALSLSCNPVISVDFVKRCRKTLKKLLMLPRGSFKSTIATNAFPLWLLWHNPDLRIMIDSETLSNAKMYLAGMKDMIENNHMLKMICVDSAGEFILEPNKKVAGGFTEEQVILLKRKKVGLKEPSLFCSGADNARTGMHPDVIICDDLVSERNVSTEAQIEKVKDHYRYSLSLLELEGLLIIIGTRYHMADLYGELIEQGIYDTLVRPAILDSGELFFPTRLTQAFLDEQRKSQGSYIFSCQYMLSPIDDSNATFKKGDIRYWYDNQMARREDDNDKIHIVTKYITVDLAISQKETADYTVIMCVGEDRSKKKYVLEYDRGRYLPNDTIKNIFEMYNRHKGSVKAVGIETVAYQKAMLYYIKDEMRRTGTYMPIKELKADKDKKRRIEALQPLFENGDIYIKKEHWELEQELLEYPYSKHDDIIDALAYILQLIKPSPSIAKPLKYEYKTKNKYVNY